MTNYIPEWTTMKEVLSKNKWKPSLSQRVRCSAQRVLLLKVCSQQLNYADSPHHHPLPQMVPWACPILPQLCLLTAARVCPGAQDPLAQKWKPVTSSFHAKKTDCGGKKGKQVMTWIFYRFNLSLNKSSSKGWVLQKEDTVQISGQRQSRRPKVCDCC